MYYLYFPKYFPNDDYVSENGSKKNPFSLGNVMGERLNSLFVMKNTLLQIQLKISKKLVYNPKLSYFLN